MTLIQTPREIFADARAVQASALERLSAGDVRDAAEKAWCATERATEALLLAVSGEIPPTTVGVSSGLRGMGRENEAAQVRSEIVSESPYASYTTIAFTTDIASRWRTLNNSSAMSHNMSRMQKSWQVCRSPSHQLIGRIPARNLGHS